MCRALTKLHLNRCEDIEIKSKGNSSASQYSEFEIESKKTYSANFIPEKAQSTL